MSEELNQVMSGNPSDRTGRRKTSDRLQQANAEILPMIFYCLQPIVRARITLFNVNKSDQLSEIILRSILKSSKGIAQPPRDHFLELALDWDCINTAKEVIIQDSLDNIHVGAERSLSVLLRIRVFV